MGSEFPNGYKYNKSTLWAGGRGCILLISLMKMFRGRGRRSQEDNRPDCPCNQIQSPMGVSGPGKGGISAWPWVCPPPLAWAQLDMGSRGPHAPDRTLQATTWRQPCQGRPLVWGKKPKQEGQRQSFKASCCPSLGLSFPSQSTYQPSPRPTPSPPNSGPGSSSLLGSSGSFWLPHLLGLTSLNLTSFLDLRAHGAFIPNSLPPQLRSPFSFPFRIFTLCLVLHPPKTNQKQGLGCRQFTGEVVPGSTGEMWGHERGCCGLNSDPPQIR